VGLVLVLVPIVCNSLIGNGTDELVRRHVYLIQDLSDQRPADVLSFVVQQGFVTSVRMPIEDMAAILPNDEKTLLQQDALESTGINDRQLAHTATENDCRPTNAGSAAFSSLLNSSKQSPTTSFKFN